MKAYPETAFHSDNVKTARTGIFTEVLTVRNQPLAVGDYSADATAGTRHNQPDVLACHLPLVSGLQILQVAIPITGGATTVDEEIGTADESATA